MIVSFEHSFQASDWLRLSIRLPIRTGFGWASGRLRNGAIRKNILRRPDASKPPTIFIAGRDKDARQMLIQSSMFSSAHQVSSTVRYGLHHIMPQHWSKQHAPAR